MPYLIFAMDYINKDNIRENYRNDPYAKAGLTKGRNNIFIIIYGEVVI